MINGKILVPKNDEEVKQIVKCINKNVEYDIQELNSVLEQLCTCIIDTYNAGHDPIQNGIIKINDENKEILINLEEGFNYGVRRLTLKEVKDSDEYEYTDVEFLKNSKIRSFRHYNGKGEIQYLDNFGMYPAVINDFSLDTEIIYMSNGKPNMSFRRNNLYNLASTFSIQGYNDGIQYADVSLYTNYSNNQEILDCDFESDKKRERFIEEYIYMVKAYEERKMQNKKQKGQESLDKCAEKLNEQAKLKTQNQTGKMLNNLSLRSDINRER